MAGYDNIKDANRNRTPNERRELAKIAGKASGKARRRKADFNRTLNMLLTAEIDSPEWQPLLDALGIDATLESAMLMAMIKRALDGDVKAAQFVARYAGQSANADADAKEQNARTEYLKAQTAKAKGEEMQEVADDGFIEALKSEAEEVWEE
ncbi:MAG: hypothetical protein PUK21_01470 [Peptostreptococcaceae bacterium]|nr:hypothetical protein [Peptostreptococcaceae bacterium]MDY5738678.1 hypothetical protein [Anaerovoracaceae bacterium]